MLSRSRIYLTELFKQSWLRIAGFAALALLAAAMARILSPLLPEALALSTGADAVSELLRILTSSMLAVTTFSLSIAVAAFADAAGTATPRATVLLQQDRTTQNVLATFLGAFLFGMVGLIALRARVYNDSGRVIVFAFTIIVIALVVVALIRWISHLMEFGRMGDTLDRVEKAATAALRARLARPYLGGQPLRMPPPPGCMGIAATMTGNVRHIDMAALQACAAALDTSLYVLALPGAFVAPGAPLLMATRSIDLAQAKTLHAAFTIGAERGFDHDPRFGLIVLTEIASRALSPAVNDPGTAIDILGRHVRILSHWREPAEDDVAHDRVFVPALTVDDAMDDAFRATARDGAALFEVQIKLQKSLALLRQMAPDLFGSACARLSSEALIRAETAALLPAELALIHAAAPKAGQSGGSKPA